MITVSGTPEQAGWFWATHRICIIFFPIVRMIQDQLDELLQADEETTWMYMHAARD
jgi:hypothetical protein